MKARLATTAVGLMTFLLANAVPAQDCLESLGRSPYGVSNSVAAEGDVALLSNGAALQVLDVSDPSAPSVLGEVAVVQPIEAVAISGNRGYILTYNDLHVVDLSAPTAPTVLGTFEGLVASGELDVVGNEVYVTTYEKLVVVDVSAPATPIKVGELEWTDGSGGDLEAASGFAFVAAGDSGLRVIDVSDPTTPTMVAAVDLGDDTSAYFLDLVNGLVYLSGSGSFPDRKLFVVDVTDPQHPALIANPTISGGGRDIVVRDGLAHIAGYPGLNVYDVNVPQTPVWLGSVTITSDYSERLAAIDDHILMTTYLYGLTVIDTTNPASPAPVSTVDAPGRSSDAAYSNGVLYIAAEDRGLRMVGVSDPTHPSNLGYFDLLPYQSQAFGVAAQGDVVYVIGYAMSGLLAVDVSDPIAPVILGNASGVAGEWVTVAGDHAYIVAPGFGVYVVDVSTPSQPVHIGTLDLPAGSGEWWEWPVVLGDHLFIRNNHNDPFIAIIDVGDSTTPTLVGTIDVSANVAGLAGMGSWLLVPDVDNEPLVRIFDVSNPVAPVEHDPYVPVSGYAEVVEASGSVAYLSIWVRTYPDYEFAVEAVDFGDPTAPEFMGISPETWRIDHLAAGPEGVYAVSLETGFEVLGHCQGPIFADGFESGDTSAWAAEVP